MVNNQRHVFVYNKTRETFLAFRVKVADSVLGRLIGLLGRRSLQPDSGVWIVPGNAVHTIGMLFSFDLVLIDKNFRVVGVRELVRPFTITRPNFKAESVLELPAHSIFRSRTQIGDQLLIERYEARKPSQGSDSERIEELHSDACTMRTTPIISQKSAKYRRNSGLEGNNFAGSDLTGEIPCSALRRHNIYNGLNKKLTGADVF